MESKDGSPEARVPGPKGNSTVEKRIDSPVASGSFNWPASQKQCQQFLHEQFEVGLPRILWSSITDLGRPLKLGETLE